MQPSSRPVRTRSRRSSCHAAHSALAVQCRASERRSSTQQRASNQFFNHFRADHSGPFIQNWYMVPDRTVLGVLLSPIVPMAMLPSIRMQCQCIAEGRELMQNIPNDWMHANNSCESENIVNGLGLCKPMSSRPIDERLLFTFSLMKSF